MSTRKKIMLVDDSPLDLVIGKNILSDKYDVFAVPSGEKLFKSLETFKPDLILLDIEVPGMSGYEIIKHLKADAAVADIPVIFLTGKSDPGSELKGLSLGAVDYILKPFLPPLLLKRIELHLLLKSQTAELKHYSENLEDIVKKKTKTVEELQNVVLTAMAEVVEYRDDITGGHIERTKSYLRILTEALLEQAVYRDELLSWDVEFFILSSQLHDVGKVAIPDSILQKPGKLTNEEFDMMKAHTTLGAEIIRDIEQSTTESEFLKHGEILAVSHHEKWNGTGYPYGLKGDAIPLQGRLMAFADVYDALTNERPYKKAFTHEEAVKIITGDRGTHFDPYLDDVFLANEKKFENVALTLKRQERKRAHIAPVTQQPEDNSMK